MIEYIESILPEILKIGSVFSVGGIGVLFAVIPLILKIKRNTELFIKELSVFLDKYRKDEELQRDTRTLLIRFDVLLESIADLLCRLRMKKAAILLRKAIEDIDNK